ncbi:MAG: alkaline phosphatase family protein [Thermoprotei archaeon]
MRVLLIVIDGLSYDVLERFKDQLPNISSLINTGVYGRLESVFPALTPVAIASLITGTTPKTHGIVSPKIFVKGRKLSDPISAFSSEGLLVDPIWYHLGRRGKRVIVASSPQALPDRWGLPNVKLIDPFRTKVKRCSDAFFVKEGEHRVHGRVWLVGRNGLGYEIAYPKDDDYDVVKLRPGETLGPISFDAKCKDRELKGITFLRAKDEGVYIAPSAYQTYEWSNDRELMEELWEKVFKVHGVMLDSDHHSIQRGQATLEDFMWTASLSAKFFTEYSKYLLSTRDWDFAITYFPVVDNVQHLLYGFYEQFEEEIKRAYHMADQFVSAHLDLADLVIIASDHGISRVRKRFFPNKLLMDLGLLHVNEKNEIDWSKTKAIYAGGGFFRVNLRGREDSGVVRKEEYRKVVKTIVKALESLNSEDLFLSILENEVPSGDREGDVVFVIKEPYGVSNAVRKDVNVIEEIQPLKFASGDHGYFRKDDFNGVIIASAKGAKFAKKLQRARIIDVAPTILKLYGIDNVKTEGNPIPEILRLVNRPPQQA